MALTSKSSIFCAIGEDGINALLKHIIYQRPSWFNFATEFISKNPSFLCNEIKHSPEVTANNNPIVSILSPLPVLGTNGDYALDFCAQITTLEMEFYPGNLINLPPNLNPPLQNNQIAFHSTMSIGVACPKKEVLENLPSSSRSSPTDPPIVIPTTQSLNCYQFDVYATGHMAITGSAGNQELKPKLDGVSITGVLNQQNVQDIFKCYINTILSLSVPKLSIALKKILAIDIVIKNLLDLNVVLAASTISPTLPNNPSSQDNQLKIYLEVMD